MVMLEEQGVPKVSACLRWSQGVLNFQNSPTPRVVLLSIKIDTISKKTMVFP
jgi:Iap family predicted aminopeptidase